MHPALRIGVAVVALGSFQALSDSAHPSPPDLDCSIGFEGLHQWTEWLPGAERGNGASGNTITVNAPDAWRVEITFTERGQPAHPAVVLRKFLKQVTGVWTAQSKVCGYGDKAQFAAFMADVKTEDTRLTNASRAEVERQKREASPLAR
ncbi:hypothetical protein [Hyphomicrobium sp.]|jgi:hypothetical protein|uniref:hypothetical protein n=1 Tax=Hyphomicrobium sp. TaxID=82 RepID=UPI0035669637